jgi:DNA-binding response OmpR family regulator
MKKILIADPDEVLAAVYSEELAEEGYTVTNCSDSSNLMNVIMSERPDVILIDTQMVLHPGDGFRRDIEKHLSMAPPVLYTSSLRSKPKKWAIPSERFVRKTRNLKSLKNKISAALSGDTTEKRSRSHVSYEQMAFPWSGGRK